MSGNTRVWTWETHELSEGMSSIVYDEHGMMLADHLNERTAALIASAPAMHAALEVARQVIAEVIGDRGGVLGRIEAALALSRPMEERS